MVEDFFSVYQIKVQFFLIKYKSVTTFDDVLSSVWCEFYLSGLFLAEVSMLAACYISTCHIASQSKDSLAKQSDATWLLVIAG